MGDAAMNVVDEEVSRQSIGVLTKSDKKHENPDERKQFEKRLIQNKTIIEYLYVTILKPLDDKENRYVNETHRICRLLDELFPKPL